MNWVVLQVMLKCLTLEGGLFQMNERKRGCHVPACCDSLQCLSERAECSGEMYLLKAGQASK